MLEEHFISLCHGNLPPLYVCCRIVDGVNITTDEDHMWSTPFLDGDVVVLTISFPIIVYIAALRVWNYNCTADLTYCGVSYLLILTCYTRIFYRICIILTMQL